MNPNQPNSMPPSLATLTTRYLENREIHPAEKESEPLVELHESQSAFIADARTTWTDALLAMSLIVDEPLKSTAPKNWTTWIRGLPSRQIIMLAVGHYPQMIGDLSRLANGIVPHEKSKTIEKISTSSQRPALQSPTFTGEHADLARAIFAAAAERVAGDAVSATARLASVANPTDASWQTLLQNERAMALWEKGDHAGALQSWKAMPACGVRSFNLGLAYLSTGEISEAREMLKQACTELPAESGWSHLAQLYLAVADIKS